jgi:hypothetical protein
MDGSHGACFHFEIDVTEGINFGVLLKAKRNLLESQSPLEGKRGKRIRRAAPIWYHRVEVALMRAKRMSWVAGFAVMAAKCWTGGRWPEHASVPWVHSPLAHGGGFVQNTIFEAMRRES